MKDLLDPRFVRGAARLFHVPTGLSLDAASQAAGPLLRNTVMYDWATIIAQLLRGSPDGKPYNIGAMYFEFENDAGNDVDPPAYDRSGGVEYYLGLNSHPTVDYLRIPITSSSLTTTDDLLFPAGNEVTFTAQTEGVVGVHGKAFTSAAQSRIFGGALVSTPDFDDPTQDLVFSRVYFGSAAAQLQKLASSQIGLKWQLQLQ
jgi:hypothetical protein